jgi:hypothetical protein
VAYAAPRNEEAETPYFDAQEYTGRILLGFRAETVESTSPAQWNTTRDAHSPPPRPDALASAQSVLTGTPFSGS